MAPAVLALVVLYRPDPALLAGQRAGLADQVDRVVYVDNGDGVAALGLGAGSPVTRPGDTVIGSGVNVGLAAALNVGLAHARACDAQQVLLLDQDSVPAADLVVALQRALATDPARAVAAGPAIVDELTGESEYFARLRLPLNRRIHSAEEAGAEFFDVDFLITSGTLLDLALAERVGPMDESLFIDSLDFDWSFRARAMGLRLLATFSTTLRHRRGDQVVVTPVGKLRVHSASRMYFMHRNRIRLYRRRYVPLAWKVHDVGRLVVKLGLLLIFVPGRLDRLRAVLRGIRDGLS
ncbi:MAG: glycosyltransferase [Actinomycetales bacterium]|nr:glycosyltransferase [Actinomycetales bacterium]